MKKTMTALVAGIMFVALTLAGCSTQQNSSTSDVKKVTYIVLNSSQYPSENLSMTVATPGAVKVYVMGLDCFEQYDLFAGELPPEDEYELTEYQISKEEWNALINALDENRFMELPEELSKDERGIPTLDASTYYIQVETGDGVHRSGGYMAGYGDDEEHKRFDAIKWELYGVIAKDNPPEP